MKLQLKSQSTIINAQLSLTGSKSETNRMLLLQALYPNIVLINTSNSDDSEVMLRALQFQNNDKPQIIDVHHAGTAMRFLTAFCAIQVGKEFVLTGSDRMQQRPIKILVDALLQLGAKIEYLNNIGYPPLKITGTKLSASKVDLNANVSSQYISALLLIAPKLKNGLTISLEGSITSLPYLKMTLALLSQIGIVTSFSKNVISVNSSQTTSNLDPITIESDWSSASYWYSIAALSEIGTEITLFNYKKNSLQGDAALAEIYEHFGVHTFFNDNESITLKKIKEHSTAILNIDLNNCPDIAQTISVTCFGLKTGCHLTGLETLKIKETDRLAALDNELGKLGATMKVTHDSLHLQPSDKINDGVTITTYQDHRMAMAFAPLALKTNIIIDNAEVVSKSYPTFWNDLKSVGFDVDEVN